MNIDEKEIHKQKLAWFVGYSALCAVEKKHILASPTVSFSARTLKRL